MCSCLLNDKECEVFDNLLALEASVKEETLLFLIYIAGYVQKKGGVVKKNDSLFYYQKFGKYVDALNRGSLTLQPDSLVQWCIFCVIFFQQVLNAECRKFFVDMFFCLIAVRYDFCVSKKHFAILCNILLKNYSEFCTPRSSKEAGLKILKLC